MTHREQIMPKNPPPDLTADMVMTWLRQNPDFLDQHPDAIDLLTPAKDKKQGGLVDFQHYLVKRLKADREMVLNTSRDIMETARTNMNNVTRIHRAVLRLLESKSFTEFIETITTELATQLDVDICTLVVEAERGQIPHIHIHGIRMVPDGTIDEWMNGSHIMLQSNIGGTEAIYGGGAALVRSQALVRLTIARDMPPALLAFGSRDPDLFQDGQGTDLIQFLGGVIEREFRGWLQVGI
jgi:uncharacterized protein